MKKLLVSAFVFIMSMGMINAQETKSLPVLPDNISVTNLDGKTIQTPEFGNDGKPYI
jgi:hypothetical protein